MQNDIRRERETIRSQHCQTAGCSFALDIYSWTPKSPDRIQSTPTARGQSQRANGGRNKESRDGTNPTTCTDRLKSPTEYRYNKDYHIYAFIKATKLDNSQKQARPHDGITVIVTENRGTIDICESQVP